MTQAPPTLDQVIDLAHQLSRAQRGQLIARLAVELAAERSSEQLPIEPDAARVAWAQLRADLSARPMGATSMAEQLERDRQTRDEALMGRESV